MATNSYIIRVNSLRCLLFSRKLKINYSPKYLAALAFVLLLLMSPTGIFAQQKINGIITDEMGNPLAGATIHLTGSHLAAISSADGSFYITVKADDILEISFIGFKTQQIKISNFKNLQISLQPLAIALDDIIFTGYITQKVKEITGSVAVVKSKDLLGVPAGQVEQMLQGRVAGLTVLSSGEPGSPSNVRLHGIGNFGDVTPLYIIDGVEGNINALNPYDIESLQVLKDAGAYSIYGVRGANGVIVISTKKGKIGKTRISYDAYLGTTRPLKKGLDLLTPQENADILWIALKNSGHVDPLTGNPSHPFYGNGATPVQPDYLFAGQNFNSLFENSPLVNPNLYNIDSNAGPIYQIVKFNKMGTDWFHESFKPAISHNHTIAVSGGNENNRYLLSLGYLNQQGTLINTYLERFTARINTEFTVGGFRIGENLQLSHNQNPNTGNSVAASLLTNPSLPLYDIKGNWSSFGDAYAGPTSNPVAKRVLSKYDKDNNWGTSGNVYAEVDLVKKFTFRTNFGGALNNYYDYSFNYGSYQPVPAGFPNSLREVSGYARFWTWTNSLSYKNTFKEHHHLNAFAGVEDKSSYNREQGGTRKGYFTNDPNYRFLSNGSSAGQTNYSFAGTSYLSSFISQVNYNYKEKYFVSLTLRRDGSSIFGPENRFGWFPAISAAWRITEEKFMDQFQWLNELKLRASWGKTGYQGNTDPFNQYTLYGGSAGDAYYDINGTSNTIVPGFRAVRIGNAKTGWQEDIVSNIGIESVLWEGKLNITADWYNKKSKGLLFKIPLPALLGDAAAPNVNIGEIKNTGIDLMLGYKSSLSKNWNLDAIVTLCRYRNRIIKLSNVAYVDDNSVNNARTLIRNEVGYPISSFFGYKIIGFFQDADDVAKSPAQQSAAPGRFKYFDANNDGQITDEDRVHFGNPHPKFTMGLNVGVTYKAFELSSFFYGSFGNDVLNALRYSLDIFGGNASPKSKTALYNSWTPQNQNAKAPIIEDELNFSNTGVPNSYPLENGSYFRNRTLILGYSFQKNWLQKFKIERFRIYVQAANLFTITNYTGLDPELSGTSSQYGGAYKTGSAFGIDYNGNYPNNQRQWLIGVNVGF